MSKSSSSTSSSSDIPDQTKVAGSDTPNEDVNASLASNIISRVGDISMSPGNTQPDDIPDIVDSLRAHFESDATRSLEWRKSQLHGLLSMLTKHEQHWVDAMEQDMGTHFFEAKLRIATIVHELKDAIKNVEKWMKPEKKSNPWSLSPGKTMITPEPYGVVCNFIPFNYPMYLGFSTLIPILAAGNVCLFKPSPDTPACSALYQRLVPKYLDAKGVKVVCGSDSICNTILEQRFDFIFYTGSPRVGRIIMTAAAKHLTPVILELGGKSPVYFDDDVVLTKCVKRLLFGKYFNAGQTCVSPDYCLVNKKIWDKFIKTVKEVYETFFGDPNKINDNVAHIINNSHYQRICNLIDTSEGDIIIKGVRSPERKYIGPTVILNPSLESKLMTEEIFGPVLPVIQINSANDAIKFIREREKPLAIYVMSQKKETCKLFANKTSSGALMYNDVMFHVTSINCPFGGVGNSGMGQYHGEVGFRALSHLKPIVDHKTTIDMEARYPPYSQHNLDSLMKWI